MGALLFAIAVILLNWLGRTFYPAYLSPGPDIGYFDLKVILAAALDTVIMQCLERQPENRPRSAGELGRLLVACEVEQWTAGDPRCW